METNDSPVCECDSPEPYLPPIRTFEVGDVLISPSGTTMKVVIGVTPDKIQTALVILTARGSSPNIIEVEQPPDEFNVEVDYHTHEHGWKLLTVPLVGDRIIFYQDLAIVTVTGYHHNEGSPTVEWTMHDKEGKLPIIGSLEDWKASFARQMSTGGTFEPVPRPREACNMERYALHELELLKAKHGDGLTVGMFIPEIVALVAAFGRSGQSGGSAPFAANHVRNVLSNLMSFKPLTPLTGADDEWIDQSEACGGEPLWQNNRFGSVFKGADGRSYYSDAIMWFDTDSDQYFHGTVGGISSRQYITFPYEPRSMIVRVNRLPTEDPDDHQYEIAHEEDKAKLTKAFGIEFPQPAAPANLPYPMDDFLQPGASFMTKEGLTRISAVTDDTVDYDLAFSDGGTLTEIMDRTGFVASLLGAVNARRAVLIPAGATSSVEVSWSDDGTIDEVAKVVYDIPPGHDPDKPKVVVRIEVGVRIVSMTGITTITDIDEEGVHWDFKTTSAEWVDKSDLSDFNEFAEELRARMAANIAVIFPPGDVLPTLTWHPNGAVKNIQLDTREGEKVPMTKEQLANATRIRTGCTLMEQRGNTVLTAVNSDGIRWTFIDNDLVEHHGMSGLHEFTSNLDRLYHEKKVVLVQPGDLLPDVIFDGEGVIEQVID